MRIWLRHGVDGGSFELSDDRLEWREDLLTYAMRICFGQLLVSVYKVLVQLGCISSWRKKKSKICPELTYTLTQAAPL